MENKVERYYELKQQQKELEQELAQLRADIMKYYIEQNVSVLKVGQYKVKIVLQERKEYDDKKLYAALPDPDLWRMLSKVDHAKIASLLKLNVISEQSIKDTFSLKTISLLQVAKD